MPTRFALVLVAIAALALPAVAAGAPRDAKKKDGARYYLSLGDSLSVGVQPNSAGESVDTGDGYADQLLRLKRTKANRLKLVKLGCGGERTDTMMLGGKCQYGKDFRIGYSTKKKGNQLSAAENFLRRHKGHIAFVTIDIGANDVDSCAKGTSVDLACLTNGIKSIKTNTPKIIKRLRKAAGKKVRIVAMNLYDPFLALYLAPSTRPLATASVALAAQVNTTIQDASRANGASAVADVAGAFQTSDQTTMVPYKGQSVPRDVERICTLTWMCVAAPVGPNIHANRDGYTLIARTFRPLV
jgi:lysophospholipase L1-like esterase